MKFGQESLDHSNNYRTSMLADRRKVQYVICNRNLMLFKVIWTTCIIKYIIPHRFFVDIKYLPKYLSKCYIVLKSFRSLMRKKV